MKILIKNLGALKQAKFQLGEMTIICGENNTGKTYATYALFGFLYFWRRILDIPKKQQYATRLMAEGAIKLNINDLIGDIENILAKGCEKYSMMFPSILASSEKYFSDFSFRIDSEESDSPLLSSFEKTMGTAKDNLFSILKQPNDPIVSISLLVDKSQVKVPSSHISEIVGDAIKEILFSRLFPNTFIASAERTGAAIFRKELNFARNRLLEEMSSKEKDFNPLELLTKFYSDYALPVRTNVDFTRQLEDVAKKNSFIRKEHPELLKEFCNIIGGEYAVTRNDELFFIPKANRRLKLTMGESSSAVRSLLDIGFYLRHVAQPGDLLMVDEPELNLHPENQRRVARLFARLVNLGIKVFITTHSDYIIKELNTLIMLNQNKPHLMQIMESKGYKSEDLLSADKIRVYIAEVAPLLLEGNRNKTKALTFVEANIDQELGIEARSFDTTIEDMNSIQEAIFFSGENEE